MTNQSSEFKSTPAHLDEHTHLQPAVQAWKIFLNDQGRSPYTIKAFIADLNLLDGFLAPDKTLGEITLKDLENFLYWLENDRGVPCSPKSLSRRITSVKSFFRWLQRGAVLMVDPAEKLPQITVSSPLPVVLTHPELKTALRTAENMRFGDQPDARPYVLLKLLLETGIKKGECHDINLNHLEIDNPEDAYTFIRYTNPRYRYKERKLPLSPELVKALDEYFDQYQPQEQLFPWTTRLLEYVLEDISKAAGFDKRISFDMCRWTSALSDLIDGVPSEKIRQKLGVSKVQFREVRLKLRRIALQQGYELGEDVEDTSLEN
jgi:integrase/recombinase XerD